MSSRGGGIGSTTDGAIGMMDAAYFIGRKELLDFFNETLQLNLTKIEQTASGAIACQMIDILFPNTIVPSKIHWTAKTDYEYIQNYKLLQSAFTKLHIQRYIDVDKLIRGKYQDNLEFCQWLKAFYDQAIGSTGVRDDYDPIAVRAKGKGGIQYNKEMSRSSSSTSRSMPAKPSTSSSNSNAILSRSRPTATSAVATAAAVTSRTSSSSTAPRKATTTTTTTTVSNKPTSTTGSSRVNQQQSQPLKERVTNMNTNGTPTTTQATIVVDEEVQMKLQQQEEEYIQTITELEQAIIDTEKERNFYFEKLRSVEIIIQIYQEQHLDESDSKNNIMIENILKVLYATADDEPITINEDGNVVPLVVEEE